MSVSFQVAVAKSYDPHEVKRDVMADAKINRAKMSFMQRMEADSYNKKINCQLSDMRRDDMLKARVDKIALEKTTSRNKGVSPTRGPKIVTHGKKKIFEGHGKKSDWGPLDLY